MNDDLQAIHDDILREVNKDRAKWDAETITRELKTKSTRRVDSGKRELADSPIFGGDRQGDLFGGVE